MSNSIAASGAGSAKAAEEIPHLEVRGISVRFGGLNALEDVSLKVGRGQICGLVGPNGAGKSTLLNCINGIIKPASGQVLLTGEPITAVPLRNRARLGIGRTFQHVELFGEMTVLDNLMLGRNFLMRSSVWAAGLFYGAGRRQEIDHRRRVEKIIEFCELERWRKERVKTLSYGVQKVVGLARALCAEPQLLLLDEVASGLNREEKEDLARFLLRIKHQLGITMVWVEHDVRMVTELADVVTVLQFGRKILSGPPDQVMQHPAVREAFIGNVADGLTQE